MSGAGHENTTSRGHENTKSRGRENTKDRSHENTKWIGLARFVAVLIATILFGSDAWASERYALIVTGATGSPEDATKYQSWRNSLIAVLRDRFGYPGDHIVVLAEEENRGTGKPTRENVRAALADLQRRSRPDDVVLVLLTGHGNTGGMDEAKFNLVGPDLGADEWAAAVAAIPARIVFVNTSSGSYPFLQKLAKPGRIVITATNSAAQEYETIFPEFLVAAFDEPSADADKNARVSMWEAFVYATSGVRKWFDDKGQLLTERALLDDTGRGVGREADDPKGEDGAIAKVTYLRPDAPITAPANTELGDLMRRRAQVQSQLDLLRARKPNLPEADYEAQLEKLLVEIARLDRDIRERQR